MGTHALTTQPTGWPIFFNHRFLLLVTGRTNLPPAPAEASPLSQYMDMCTVRLSYCPLHNPNPSFFWMVFFWNRKRNSPCKRFFVVVILGFFSSLSAAQTFPPRPLRPGRRRLPPRGTAASLPLDGGARRGGWLAPPRTELHPQVLNVAYPAMHNMRIYLYICTYMYHSISASGRRHPPAPPPGTNRSTIVIYYKYVYMCTCLSTGCRAI